VRKAFKESAAVRFEGNNYSDEWVKEAESRGLPNLRRTPEALESLIAKPAKKMLTSLGVFTKEELESRYHVRMERYSKDLLIEMNTLKEMIDTLVLPAAYAYAGQLAEAAAQAKAAGIAVIPQIDAANEIGTMIQTLRTRRGEMVKVLSQAEGMHDELEKQAKLLTGAGADAMEKVRETADALELAVGDEYWPLPKYREILFPV
jgi:glutamine synthetase